MRLELVKEYNDNLLHRRLYHVNEGYDVEIRDINGMRSIQFQGRKSPFKQPKITYSDDKCSLSFTNVFYMDNEISEMIENINIAVDAINKTKTFLNSL